VFQSLNAGFLIALAPFFSMLWPALERRGLNPSTPVKFALGIVQVGLGFGLLVLGTRSAGPDGLVPVVWLSLLYLFHTTGELSISPVGLSTVTKLSPGRLVGTVMGAWFLTIAFGHNLAGIIAKFTKIEESAAATRDPVETLSIYAGVYEKVFLGTLAVAFVLLLLTPLIRRLMHGVK
jgi:POT family proton-dependent oligopeptide transporter